MIAYLLQKFVESSLQLLLNYNKKLNIFIINNNKKSIPFLYI